MRRAVVLVGLLVALVGSAAADDAPKPLRIEAKLDGDMARFSVRYLVRAEPGSAFHNPLYSLPHRGLITSAVVTERGQRHMLDLVPAAQAQEGLLWGERVSA